MLVSLERSGKSPFWDLVRIIAEGGEEEGDLLDHADTEMQQLPPLPVPEVLEFF